MSEPVKVLIVIGQLEVGGTEQHLLSILPEINRAPLACTVYALRGGGGRLETAFVKAGIRIISPPHHSRRWLGLLRTAGHLLATLRAERPRIVHYFLPEAYLLGGLCSLLAPRCVRIMSRRSLNRYQGKWTGARSIERFLHRRMDGIVANSQAVLANLREEGARTSVSAVIYNGVQRLPAAASEAAAGMRVELGLTADTIVLIMVANLIPYKGHADLINALDRARDRLPEPWALLLIGADDGIEASLQRQAQACGVGVYIHWLGRQDDVQRYLSIADVALLTSHEEGFSNAILEAMAAGLPLIVTDVGGNAEAVLDGETGLVVPPRDAGALAEAIVELVADKERRRNMGRAGRARAVEHFPIEACVQAHRRIYLSLARGDRMPNCDLIRAAPSIRSSTVTRLPTVLFAVTEDWYFWSHRKPLAGYLRERGCKISIATRFNRHEAQLLHAGFQCIALPFERSLRYPLQDLRAVFGLWSAVRRIRPDIVHLVSLKPILLSCLALLTHRQTQFVAAFTGMGYLFSSHDRRARWFQRCVVRLLRMVLRRQNVWIIVQNTEDQALLEAEGLGIEVRTVLIPGVGVDTNEFAFADITTAEPPLVVLPARLIRDKGIEEFVAAARIVKQTQPATRFVLVGADDPDNPAAIPSAVVDTWVKEGVVEWWGHRQDMPAVYHEAQIVCLPSYREGLPKVLLEAAACGRPLIASDVAGCREVCRDGINGIRVPPRAAEPLAAAIARLLASPEMQRTFGAAGRNIVEREYAVEHIGQQTLACYQRLLGEA